MGCMSGPCHMGWGMSGSWESSTHCLPHQQDCSFMLEIKLGERHINTLPFLDTFFILGPPPNSSFIITDYPAYFSITTCTGNLYHYWGDSIIQLYALLQQTGRLHSTVPNMVYYRQPLSDFENILKADGRDNCVSMHRFEDILFSLSVRKDHMSYHDEKPNTCYKNAVFGTVSRNLPSNLQMVNNVVNYSGITNNTCSGSTVLLLGRNNRRILNMEEMRKVALKMGFKNVTITKFEKRTFKEQLNLIRCTDILIGKLLHLTSI